MPDKLAIHEPVIFQIGDHAIGGHCGEYPTALMLSVFHQKDHLVTDHKTGHFDKKRLLQYLQRATKLSVTTGNPLILDVLAETPEAMVNYLTFLTDTASTIPFLIDSSNSETRLAGISYVSEIGRSNLTIYDSITQRTSEEELKHLKDAKIEAAIILAHNPLNLYPAGRLDVLKGTPSQEGLLAKADRAGITKLFIDTVALDLAGLSLAAAAIPLVKHQLGLPAGAGSANSVAIWRRAKQLSPAAKRYLAPALCTYLQYAGADFIMPGPLRHAPRFFTTTAVTDGLLAFAPPNGPYPPPPPKTKHHPRYTTL